MTRVDIYSNYSVRGQRADLPITANFTGGIAAQEVIKLLTNQYIPISGLHVVDMIEGKTTVLT